MPNNKTIRALLTDAGRLAQCKAARAAWARETMAAFRKAHRKADDAWTRIFDALPDGLSEEELDAMHIPPPPEQAELDRIEAQIRAVIDEDRWPRELYWGGI